MFKNLIQPKAQAFHIVLFGGVLLVAFCGWILAAGKSEDVSAGLGIAVCLAGAVGAVANNFFRRMGEILKYNPRTDAKEDLELCLMTLQIYVSPLVGALFAFALYIAFMSGILEASIFPKFSLPNYVDFKTFVKTGIPVTGADAAKALFWSFVAGFLERFVPNVIDTIAKQGEDEAREKEHAGNMSPSSAPAQEAAGASLPSLAAAAVDQHPPSLDPPG